MLRTIIMYLGNISSWKIVKNWKFLKTILLTWNWYVYTCVLVHVYTLFKTFVRPQILFQSLNFEILKIRQQNTSDFVCYINSVELKINKTTQPLCQLKQSFRTHFLLQGSTKLRKIFFIILRHFTIPKRVLEKIFIVLESGFGIIIPTNRII